MKTTLTIIVIAIIISANLLKPVITEMKEDKTIEEHTIIMASLESGLDPSLKVVLDDGSIHYYHTNFIQVDTEKDYSYTQRVGKYSPNVNVYLSKEDYKTIFGMQELNTGKEIQQCQE